MTIIVRRARCGDLTDVARLLAETWHATYDDWLGSDRVREITRAWHGPGQLAAQAEASQAVFLVAQAGAQAGTAFADMAGTAFAHMDGTAQAEIGRLYVHPRWQGRGIGGMLLEGVMAAMPDIARFHLDVDPRNTRAIAFYTHHGFAVTGRGDDGGGEGSGLEHLVMERIVTVPRR